MNPEKQRKLQEYTRAIAEILYTEAESEQQFTQRKYRKNYSDTASTVCQPRNCCFFLSNQQEQLPAEPENLPVH